MLLPELAFISWKTLSVKTPMSSFCAATNGVLDNGSAVARGVSEHARHFESLLNLTQRLRLGLDVRVVTLGGSVPYGNNCVRPDGATHRSCSWPGRLVATLRKAFPSSRIAHHNLASGGNGVVHILSTLGIVLSAQTDMILLDSLVNDAWRSGSESASKALEVLVRTVHHMAPSAALLVVEGAPPGLGDAVALEKRKILDHYRVATLDWHAAATRFPHLWHPGPIAGSVATDVNHPSFVTHQQIADTISGLWGRAMRRACRRAEEPPPRWWPEHTLWRAEDLADFDVCLAPLSVYASAPSDSGATPSATPQLAGGWHYYADRPNKYGWIGEQAGARIRFEMRFGSAPRFMLTYLRSYEHVGRIELSLPSVGFRAEVDALWSDRASQSDVLWFGTTQGHDMTISYNTHYVPLQPNSTHMLEAQLLDTPTREGGNKFKIIQLISC
jgi:hypothetical protein